MGALREQATPPAPKQINSLIMSVFVSAGKKIKLGVVIDSDRGGAAGVCVRHVVYCVMLSLGKGAVSASVFVSVLGETV